MNEVRYLMSQKLLNRYSVISRLIEGSITTLEAAESLGLSERQIKRLKKGVMEEGPAFLIHKNTGRKPVHAISDDLAKKIIELRNHENYKDANFLHFQELLEEYEGITISYKPLYSILTKAGFKSPKKRRKVKPHNRRKRKSQEGLLIQMDATPFAWFGNNEIFALHGAIDDATGKIVGLYLTKNECLQGYFEVTRQILLNHGVPASIYADRHSIFRSPKADKLSIEEQLAGKVVNDTQFQRAMRELGVTIIPARSAQAKGRVERLWDTLQSRLPVEFKIAGITNVGDANEFLARYIPLFNEKFAVEPENPQSAFTPVKQGICIDNILCFKQLRTIDNGGVFVFKGGHFQPVSNGKIVSIPAKSQVNVLISPIFGVKVQFKNVVYDVVPFIKPKKKANPNPTKEKNTYRPPEDHYYKYGKDLWPKLSFAESNNEIIQMLEEIFLQKYA
jgi:transposase